jgi:hypothetical protein
MKKIKGVKYDNGKPRWSLLPWKETEEIVKVLTHGAIKYPEKDNWKKVTPLRERYYDALLRHVTAWWHGEKEDPETRLSHLAHAGCCILFLMWSDNKEKK